MFTSCQEELESWDSETLEYSGRFVFKLMSEDMSDTYVDYGYEIQLYNTAKIYQIMFGLMIMDQFFH